MTSPSKPTLLATEPALSGGYLLANLLHFARLLRRLGMRVSASQVCDLAAGLEYIDLARRDDVYYAARSVFVHSPSELELFNRAFDLFWGAEQPQLMEAALVRKRVRANRAEDEQPESDEAVLRQEQEAADQAADTDQPEPEDTALSSTYSPVETLHHKDFASFTNEEMQTARRILESLAWKLNSRLTRRRVRASKRTAYLDLPRAIRNSTRQGGEIIRLAWRRRKPKPRPLVVICDISGSMDRYSRLFLHFIHTLAQEAQRVEAFVFGTRLTRITPALRHHDVDTAIDQVSSLVQDWSGGTRIGESLKTFNYLWGRRVLSGGAFVIIISDGWDRGDIALLRREISRLHRSAYRLVWLNPLLGAPDYQPLVRGISTVLPHVDDFLPLHNLLSLEQLASRLGAVGPARRGLVRSDELHL